MNVRSIRIGLHGLDRGLEDLEALLSRSILTGHLKLRTFGTER